MSYYSEPLSNLIKELQRLPGIGPKTAQRLAFFIIEGPSSNAEKLARSISLAKTEIRFCKQCFNFASQDLCPICMDTKRDTSLICVVEDAKDIIAIEKTHHYKGLYHVLHGTISPIDGVGPEHLKIAELVERVKNSQLKEIVIATNPNIEGEQTAMYISKLLKEYDVKTTRIASGLPVGGDLEYADEITLGRALDGRREL